MARSFWLEFSRLHVRAELSILVAPQVALPVILTAGPAGRRVRRPGQGHRAVPHSSSVYIHGHSGGPLRAHRSGQRDGSPLIYEELPVRLRVAPSHGRHFLHQLLARTSGEDTQSTRLVKCRPLERVFRQRIQSKPRSCGRTSTAVLTVAVSVAFRLCPRAGSATLPAR